MLKRMLAGFFLVCLSLSTIAADSIKPGDLKAGTHYVELKEPVTDAPQVVEFFSFYCPPCYGFADLFKVNEHVASALPSPLKVEKYHVSAMGRLGKELTEAWSIAMSLGVESKVEKPLFEAVQREKNITSEADIQKVFADAGIPEEEYKKAKNSFQVKALIKKQETMAKKFGVTGTPSYYVSGKYQVLNRGIQAESYDAYGRAYADVVYRLFNKKNK